MKGLGLDLSTSAIGYSIWDDDKLIYCNKIIPQGDNWRERVQDSIQSLQLIIEENDIKKIVCEDVPMMAKSSSVLLCLGSCQGMVLTLAKLYDIDISFQAVGTWRKLIGISTGDKTRDEMKQKSILKCNELFGTSYEIHYTKGGKYKSEWDDITDSVLIYASTFEKYQQVKSFGKKRKEVD